ncbi:MAG TPA: ornithine cyclodeaminase family protein [Candidatus Sulfopaludibacter sp.]|nr:ornithine cyclodeaminase family protein [Candidatus Sulfopaludibacter sp.]
MPLWLSEAHVRASLSLPEVMGAMESALAAFSARDVAQPVRTVIELRDREFFALMPAYDPGHGLLGAKLVSVVPRNAAKGLHTHLAAISLFDADTGELLAVMDGRWITEIRTAAASAVSVRHLARRDAAVLAILGSGVQARSHLQALPLVREFREIRAWSPTPGHLHQFAAATGAVAMDSAEAAVRGAGVVVLATSSVTPAIDSTWVGPGTHVIAIGACRPSQREIDPALVARSRLFVDSKDAALKESGDVIPFGPDHVRAELGDVIAGRAPGRASPEEVTLFKSLGLAIEDVTAAGLAYRTAKAAGRGIEVAL